MTELPTDEHITGLLGEFFHATPTGFHAAAVALAELPVDDHTWIFVNGAVATAAGVDLRRIAPSPADGFYALDPNLARTKPEAAVIANQLVAAAANRDDALLFDILAAHADASLVAAFDDPEAILCRNIGGALLGLAHQIHTIACPGRHA